MYVRFETVSRVALSVVATLGCSALMLTAALPLHFA
jgi:hypothetical protein